MAITGKNFIGKTLSAKGGEGTKALNPATGETIEDTFISATEEEVQEVMALASKAYQQYKTVSGAQKADFLDAIADEILALGDELVERATAETALPAARIQGERGRTMGQLKAFASLVREGSWLEATIDTAQPDREPLPKPDARRMLMPMGPVVVFAASNFPLAFSTAGGDTASALAAGNPVIVKAHSGHPGTSELIASAIIKAAEKTGMPDGVFSMLHGGGATVGQALIKHPAVKAAGFTGSEGAGRTLFDLANQRPEPIPFFAEMGSINPVLLLPQALETRGDAIADMYAGSITMGVGQFCTNPGLLIAKNSPALDSFVSRLSNAIREIAPGTMLNKRVYEGYAADRTEALSQPGVELAAESNQEDNAEAHQGRPTVASVSAETFLGNPNLHTEVFGPYTLLVKCESDAQLEAVSATIHGQLTATVMAEDGEIENYADVIDQLTEKTGRIIFNGVPTGVEVCASMQHGGPYPASSDSRFTSVGTAAIKRFVRPICFQSWPQAALPDELKDGNPLNIWRLVDNEWTKD